MKRGTPALIVASSRIACAPTITSRNRSSLSGAALWRACVVTAVPRSSRAFTTRPPGLPAAPTKTMGGPFMIPQLEKGACRCKGGSDPKGGLTGGETPGKLMGPYAREVNGG